MSRPGIPFVKGHGTGNDFVILPDPTGALTVTPVDRARALRSPPGHRGRWRPRGHQDVPTSPTSPIRRTWPRGSWTTATPTAVWPRCAETGRECSSRTCSRRGWPARGASTSRRAGDRDGSPWTTRVRSGSTWAHRRFLERDDIQVWPAEARPGSTPSPAIGVLMPNPHAVTWVDDVRGRGPSAGRADGHTGRGLSGGRERRVRASPVRGPPPDAGVRAGSRGDAELRHGRLCGRGRDPPSGRRGAATAGGSAWMCPVGRWGSPGTATARWSSMDPPRWSPVARSIRTGGRCMSETPDLLDRQALRRVPGLSTELEDVTRGRVPPGPPRAGRPGRVSGPRARWRRPSAPSPSLPDWPRPPGPRCAMA